MTGSSRTTLSDHPTVRLAVGDCLDVLAALGESTVDAIVTDPPYGIGFMGHEWDQPDVEHRAGPGAWEQPPAPGRTAPRSRGSMEAGKYDMRAPALRAFGEWSEAWGCQAWRVLRPGGHLVSFAGTRTYHRMVCGLEDAGFEIRDQLAWLFGSGFPKSKNVGDGRGTALKPGHEPVCLARKPLGGTVAATVAEHGTGALNIDACRIGTESTRRPLGKPMTSGAYGPGTDRSERDSLDRIGGSDSGRWPANVVLDDEAASQLDEQTGRLTSGYAEGGLRRRADQDRTVYGGFSGQDEYATAIYGDSGGASRFFYVAKPDKAERHAGLGAGTGLFADPGAPDRNDHPTVKPIELMRWLVRLVTPPGGVVLDPFLGSGTTAIAAALEHRSVIGIEREPEYMRIARARLAHWAPGVGPFDLDTPTTERAA